MVLTVFKMTKSIFCKSKAPISSGSLLASGVSLTDAVSGLLHYEHERMEINDPPSFSFIVEC